MTRSTWVGSIAGFVAGFVVAALLHNYPKTEVTRHRYCQVCAEYEETYEESVIMGGDHGRKTGFSGPVGRLLDQAVGEHEHRFTEWATIFPTFGVPDEHPEVAAAARRIREMEESPRIIWALADAMRNDQARTVALIQRLLDPAGGTPLTITLPLEGDAPWPEKWAKVEAELARPAKR